MTTIAGAAKTAIVTGASQGIGAATAQAFLERGYNVVATSLSKPPEGLLKENGRLKFVAGDIGDPDTARRVVDSAVGAFGRLDALVNNAGIFVAKPFTEYTDDDFKRLVSTNLEGFLHMTQLAIRRMLAQKSGGSVVTVTAALADHPIAGSTASVAMITKGGLNTATRALAMDYARDGIRVNAVAPGVVDTPLHARDSSDALRKLNPMGTISGAEDVAGAVLFLSEAPTITGEVLCVDGGAHLGKW